MVYILRIYQRNTIQFSSCTEYMDTPYTAVGIRIKRAHIGVVGVRGNVVPDSASTTADSGQNKRMIEVSAVCPELDYIAGQDGVQR